MTQTIESVIAKSAFGRCLRFDLAAKTQPAFWEAWGIELDPTDPAVRKAIREAYAVEWIKPSKVNYESVAKAAQRAGLGDSNCRMNRALA